MKRAISLLASVSLFSALNAATVIPPAVPAGPARLLRQPSYSKGNVAFSYLGDIWIARDDGTNLRRLTDHKARDVYPKFSPDGQWIAFSSNREGNHDVFVIPVQGGKARQLTFHSADDIVVGWRPDGARILFASARGQGVFPGVTTLFEIAAEGGMEEALPTDWGSWGAYSPDGSKLALTRHPGTWSRKHYRGSYAVDLWLMEVGAKKFTRLGDADYKGNSLWPMYGNNGEIYFVADRLPSEQGVKFGGPEVMKSANNIWKISEKGGPAVQVTHHTSGNLFFPSISADGKTIVYEENFGLWKLDTATGKSVEIRLEIRSDTKDSDVELRTVQGEAESFSLSPSGKRAAVATHGEVFTVATDRGEVQRVTETFWREQSPRWSPNGKWIAFSSDRTGREELWMADERGHNLKQLSDADCDKSSATWSPDSKSILWSGSDHKLRRVNVETVETEVLASSEAGPVSSPQFSPDGKWISYSKPDAILRSHVYIKALGGTNAEQMIGAEDFLTSSGARWTPDGRKLLLLGGIGAPSMSSLNRTVLQLYSASLTHITNSPYDRDVDTEEQAQAADSRRGRPAGADPAGAAAKVEVKIEWDGLDRRIRQISRTVGSVLSVAPSPDSRTYAFVASGSEGDEGGGRPALYTIADDGTRLTQVAAGTPPDPTDDTPRTRGGGGGGFGELQWSKDGRSLFYMQGGGIYSVGIAASPATESAAPTAGAGRRGTRSGAGSAPETSAAPSATPRRVAFTVRLEIDQSAERWQVFEEAWRVMKFRFYDPHMHGVNWAAARETYEPLLSHVADSDELHSVIMQMIGELNASHTGVTGGGRTDGTERAQTRYPGFDLSAGEKGFYKISHIYRRGPADHDYVNLSLGNYVLAVNGKNLAAGVNYWRLFNLAPGRKFEFLVNSKPETNGAWVVSLEPMSATAQGNIDYDRWVESRREMVEKISGGEIGYLHIRAMNAASLQKFQRDLLANLGRKALVIDERFNGGGGIDQELLEILNQRIKYQSYRGRDSVEIPRPVQAFFGPMVVLQNERSASNAEMFPEGFRALGLGKVVGVPTMGAVIGTGAYRLLDGSTIRTPGIGVFTARGESLENYGVQPDVWVDNLPEDFLSGHDRQIEKAVEVLRAQMKN